MVLTTSGRRPSSPSSFRSFWVNAVDRLYMGWFRRAEPRRRTSTRSWPSEACLRRYVSTSVRLGGGLAEKVLLQEADGVPGHDHLAGPARGAVALALEDHEARRHPARAERLLQL